MNLRELQFNFKEAFCAALAENADSARCSLLSKVIEVHERKVPMGWWSNISDKVTSEESLYPSSLSRLLAEGSVDLKCYAETEDDEGQALSLMSDAIRALTDHDIVRISKSLHARFTSHPPLLEGELGHWNILEIENFPNLQSLYSPKFEVYANGLKIGTIECKKIERRSGRIVWMYYARVCGRLGNRKNELHYSLQGAWADVLTQAKEASRLAQEIRCSILNNKSSNG